MVSLVVSKATLSVVTITLIGSSFVESFVPKSRAFVPAHKCLAYNYNELSFQLKQSAVSDPSITQNQNEKSSSDIDVDRLDLPWKDVQIWALRDQLPKYTVQVPMKKNNRDTIQVYSLWRTLSNEVTELSGYPLPFLLERQAELMKKNETSCATTLEILPYLDEFEFESNGGLSGRVYGVAGVADGTRIQTTPVGDVQTTIPKGFVRTEDGAVIYELGKPIQEVYSLDGTSKNALVLGVGSATKSLGSSMSRIGNPTDENPILDEDLIRLGGLTSLVIGGALAIEMMSHHLTINVFWV